MIATSEIIDQAISTISNWPAALVLVVFLVALGATMRAIKVVPNKIIPVTLIVLGGLANFLVGETGKVSPNQRHPDVLLVMTGVVYGFIAWGWHAGIVKMLEKFLPGFKADVGNTVEMRREDVEKALEKDKNKDQT